MLKLSDFDGWPTGRIWWDVILSLIYIVTLSKKSVQPKFGEIPPLSIAARGPQSLTFSRKWPHFKRFHAPQFLKESCQILNFFFFSSTKRATESDFWICVLKAAQNADYMAIFQGWIFLYFSAIQIISGQLWPNSKIRLRGALRIASLS